MHSLLYGISLLSVDIHVEILQVLKPNSLACIILLTTLSVSYSTRLPQMASSGSLFNDITLSERATLTSITPSVMHCSLQQFNTSN